MIFLVCTIIYLSGLGYCYAQVTSLESERTHLEHVIWRALLIMMGLCAAACFATFSQSIFYGILQSINLLIVHMMWVQPLMVFSVLGVLFVTRRTLLKQASWRALVPCVMVTAVSILGLWSTRIEPYWLDVVHASHSLHKNKTTFARPLTVAILADLQNDSVGSFQQEILQEVREQQPDMILIPGDLYDTEQAEQRIAEFQRFLSQLHAPLGVFMVVGDHDRLPVLRTMTQGTDVHVLDNTRAYINTQGKTVEVIGLSSSDRSSYQLAMQQSPPPPENHVDVRIALVHRPRYVLNLKPEDQIDLVVSGHTHGGQINIPLFGPPVTLSPLPREVAAGGLHHLDSGSVYISRGLGGVQHMVPLIRFNCRPELTLLTIE